MVGAHTDSPCLMVKPKPETQGGGYLQLGVEVYGGALLNPWFDRDLSLAGRVSYLAADGTVATALVDFPRPRRCDSQPGHPPRSRGQQQPQCQCADADGAAAGPRGQ
jgi:hypothetical protein